jgi:hypothetical protein
VVFCICCPIFLGVVLNMLLGGALSV